MQMRYRREHAAEFFLETFQRRDQRGEIARPRIGGEVIDRGLIVGEHGVDGGEDLVGRDCRKGWQLAIGEQGVGGRGHALKMAGKTWLFKRDDAPQCPPIAARSSGWMLMTRQCTCPATTSPLPARNRPPKPSRASVRWKSRLVQLLRRRSR